ncbi:MAG: radical SAM protein [Tannerellaceae bacterium]|jgi:2-iminoacetate synthase|nr:radical SAM protein [Tannerellaceae bacterium]
MLVLNAPLLSCLETDGKEFETYYQKAVEITGKHFENKRTLFNPIYVSDVCLADCPYCGFRGTNVGFKRKTLKPEETVREALFLKERGINCILILAGDYKHSKYVEMLYDNIKAVKEEVNPGWIGIEVATLEIAEYAKLREAGANSVTVFQETYNRTRYSCLHQVRYKGDFDFRFNAQKRAILAGFEEVGLGVLYGIGFWKEDTIAMAEHALKLREEFPNVKFRFSFPRLQLSRGQDRSCRTEQMTTSDLRKAITGIRLTFPQDSLVLTGRETVKFLCKSAAVVDTLGYAGQTTVGGYTLNVNGNNQFKLNKTYAYDYFINELKENGWQG